MPKAESRITLNKEEPPCRPLRQSVMPNAYHLVSKNHPMGQRNLLGLGRDRDDAARKSLSIGILGAIDSSVDHTGKSADAPVDVCLFSNLDLAADAH